MPDVEWTAKEKNEPTHAKQQLNAVQHILTSSCILHAMQHTTLHMSFVHFVSKGQQQNITLLHSSGQGI